MNKQNESVEVNMELEKVIFKRFKILATGIDILIYVTMCKIDN